MGKTSKFGQGRMVRTKIARARAHQSLYPEAAALFLFVLPHLDSHGKLRADPIFIKGACVPYADWANEEAIGRALKEISDKTLLKWFEFDGAWWLHALDFWEWQDIKQVKPGQTDHLPDYPGLQTTPEDSGQLQAEGKGEEEAKGEPEDRKLVRELKGARRAISREVVFREAKKPGAAEKLLQVGDPEIWAKILEAVRCAFPPLAGHLEHGQFVVSVLPTEVLKALFRPVEPVVIRPGRRECAE